MNIKKMDYLQWMKYISDFWRVSENGYDITSEVYPYTVEDYQKFIDSLSVNEEELDFLKEDLRDEARVAQFAIAIYAYGGQLNPSLRQNLSRAISRIEVLENRTDLEIIKSMKRLWKGCMFDHEIKADEIYCAFQNAMNAYQKELTAQNKKPKTS